MKNETKRERVARELHAWARTYAGSRLDLDPELEEAGLETLQMLEEEEALPTKEECREDD